VAIAGLTSSSSSGTPLITIPRERVSKSFFLVVSYFLVG
jgi:hypothetical protein